MPSGPWEDFAAPTTSQGEEGPWQDFASTSKIGGLSTSTDPLSPEALAADNKTQLVDDLKAGARKQVNNAVGLVDMALGIPGQMLGIGADIGGRINALAHGGSRADAELVGKMNRESPSIQAASAPLASFMKGLGWGDDFDKSDVSNVMGGLMKAVESGGEWVNEKTNEVISKEDVVSLFNTTMGALGGRAMGTLDPKIKAIGAPKLPTIEDPYAGSQTPQADAFKAKVDARAAEFAKREAEAKQKDGTGTPEEAAAAWDNWARAYTEEASGTSPKAEVPPSPGIDPVAPPMKAQGPGSMRGSPLLLPAAIAATGLGLAYQFGDQKDLVSAAIGGGIVLAGRGKGIDLARLETLPDTTPLGTIRDQMGYTFTTLERLPAGRPIISRQLITEQLKRQDITAAEKGVFDEALKMLPEGDVSAKQLVGALKVVADDWELKKVDSDSFADYGLEGIDRKVANEWNAEPWIPDDATPQEIATLQAENAQGRAEAVPPSTHIYQLPNISLGKNNHFSDPNYFGHTRVFFEDGVRHVVEIQSDLAQRAGKVLTEADRGILEEIKKTSQEALDNLKKGGATGMSIDSEAWLATTARDIRGLDYYARQHVGEELERAFHSPDAEAAIKEALEVLDDPNSPAAASLGFRRQVNNALMNAEDRLRVGVAEAQAKLAESSSTAAISPLLKNWHKRLVREELADATKPKPNPEWEKAKIELERAEWQLQNDLETKGNMFPDMVEATRETVASRKAKLEATPQEIPPKPTVRFATADTVAKVEGWPENTHPAVIRLENAKLDLEHAKRTRDRYEERQAIARLPGSEMVRQEWGDTFTKRQKAVDDAAQLVEAARARGENLESALSPEHQGIYDRYKGDVEKFLRQLGGKPVTDSAGHTWIEVPVEGSKQTPAGSRAQMFGGIDPKVAGVMAAMGISGALIYALSDKHKLYGALTTAAATALIGLTVLSKSKNRGISSMAKSAIETLEDSLSTNSYQIEKLSPPIARAQRRFELLNAVAIQDRLHRSAAWVEGLRHVPEAYQTPLAAALLSGSRTAVDAILVASGQTKLRPALAEVMKMLPEVGAELKEMKLLKNLIPDYYPRIVADYPGLLEALGSEGKQFVEKKLAQAEARSIDKTGQGLDELQRSAILNQALQDSLFARGGEGRKFLKNRTVAQVTEQLVPFYESPADTLPIYLRAATNAIEKARFFGKNLVLDPETGKINNNASIGNVVNRQVEAGKLSPEGRQEVERLMRARFGPGEESAARAVRALQNFTTATLVANPVTALSNVGDVGAIATMQGILPMVKGVAASALRREGRITNADMGLADTIAAEFTGASRNPVTVMGRQVSAARFLDKSMRLSGFKALDLVMKEGHFNAAEISIQKRLATARGEKEFIRRNADYFEGDLPQLIADLRAGERTALAYEYFWREVSDAQPISKSELPTGMLEHPKLRLLWQIRTFMISQLTLIRRRGVDEILRGNVRAGTSFLLRYTILAGSAGAGVNFIINSILGRDNELEWGDIPMNAFKNFGMSQYILDKAREGKLKDAASSFLSPAMGSLLDIFTSGDKAVNKIPVVGRLIYNRGMGGAEETNMKDWERKQAKKRAEERDADLTDSDREEREEKAREKKERRLERYRDRETQP